MQVVLPAPEPALMQVAALFIAPATDLPSVTAARAMAAPTMARISAYSAAEAPDWSFSRLMNVFISHPFHTFPVCPWKDMRLVRCGREE